MAHIAADAGGEARRAEGDADDAKHHAERHKQHFKPRDEDIIAFNMICVDAELFIELLCHYNAHLRANGRVRLCGGLLRLLEHLRRHGLDERPHRIEL